MKLYPILKDETPKGIFEWLKFVVRARTEDVQEFSNLPNIFISGRKVGKVPSASNDVAVTDKVGDFNADGTTGYAYFLVDNSGTAEWKRATLGSW